MESFRTELKNPELVAGLLREINKSLLFISSGAVILLAGFINALSSNDIKNIELIRWLFIPLNVAVFGTVWFVVVQWFFTSDVAKSLPDPDRSFVLERKNAVWRAIGWTVFIAIGSFVFVMWRLFNF